MSAARLGNFCLYICCLVGMFVSQVIPPPSPTFGPNDRSDLDSDDPDKFFYQNLEELLWFRASKNRGYLEFSTSKDFLSGTIRLQFETFEEKTWDEQGNLVPLISMHHSANLSGWCSMFMLSSEKFEHETYPGTDLKATRMVFSGRVQSRMRRFHILNQIDIELYVIAEDRSRDGKIDIDRHPIKAVLSLIVGHIKVTDHSFCLPDVYPMTFCGGKQAHGYAIGMRFYIPPEVNKSETSPKVTGGPGMNYILYEYEGVVIIDPKVTVDGESYDLNSSFVGDTTERELHYKANFPLFDEYASTSFAMMLNPTSVFADLIPESVNPGSILREYITGGGSFREGTTPSQRTHTDTVGKATDASSTVATKEMPAAAGLTENGVMMTSMSENITAAPVGDENTTSSVPSAFVTGGRRVGGFERTTSMSPSYMKANCKVELYVGLYGMILSLKLWL